MDIAIPENIVNEAVRRFGRRFLFVYPEKFYTDEDIFAERRPTGRRYYGICTACGELSENVEAAMNENEKYRTKKPYYDKYSRPPLGYVKCPECGAFVEARKGNIDKSCLRDAFYLKAWDVESPEKVILYEACIYLENWANSGPQCVSVKYQRKTVLALGKAETYEYWYKSWYGDEKEWVKQMFPKDASGSLPKREVELGEEKLAGTFLEKIYDYVTEKNLSFRYLIRFVEEPLTELFYKMGFTAIANDRVYKDKQSKGTRHIDFTQRSPKKMFRGCDESTVQKIRQFMDLVGKKSSLDCAELEAAIMALKKCKGATPEALADMLDNCRHNFISSLRLCGKVNAFPFGRVADYINAHDGNIYRDYIETCILNGAPLNEARTAFPEDLYAAHDEQVEKHEFAIKRESFEKCAKRAEKLRKQGYEFECGGICTVIPEKPTDIQREGTALCHCVGKLYTDKHVSGYSNIIFIRRASDPQKPWFTLEADPETRRFRQCFGYKNRMTGASDPEVGPFLIKYAAHLDRCAKRNIKQEEKSCQKKTA